MMESQKTCPSKYYRPLAEREKVEFVELFANEHDLALEFIQPWHLRLTHPDGRRLDYFPKSGRATWVSSGRWFQIEDIEQYLIKEFSNDTSSS